MSSLAKWRLCFIVAILSISPYQANAQTTAVTPAGDTVYLYNDGSYRIQKRTTKENLQLKSAVERLGKKHSASSREIEEAYSLASQGWRYTLPRPKSPQAAWGNTDGRTEYV